MASRLKADPNPSIAAADHNYNNSISRQPMHIAAADTRPIIDLVYAHCSKYDVHAPNVN